MTPQSECQSCRINHRCLVRAVAERETAFAWAEGRETEPCEFYIKELFVRPERLYVDSFRDRFLAGGSSRGVGHLSDGRGLR